MATLFEGSCIGKAVDIEFGIDNKEKPRVRWSMQVTAGPHIGKRANYSGKFDAGNIKWTKRDMMLIGWKGKDVRTFLDDVRAANREISFDAEIARFERSDGSVSEWTSVRMSGAAPLAPAKDDTIAEVNKWFSEAEEIGPPKSDGSETDGSETDAPF